MVSSTLKIVAAIVIVVVVVVGAYAALTFPRAVVDFQVSFTMGVDRELKRFEVPALHDKAQVEVIINSGSALWRASIANANGIIWQHSAAQGGQTTYRGDWIALPSGQYNFTFETIGFGELNANIRVTSKGGFW